MLRLIGRLGGTLIIGLILILSGGVSAQSNQPYAITAQTIRWLALEMTFDLGLLPDIYEPTWGDSTHIYVPVGDAPIQIADVDQQQLFSFGPTLMVEANKGYFAIEFNAERTHAALLRRDIGDINQLEMVEFSDVPTVTATYPSATTGQMQFVGDTLYFSPGQGAIAITHGSQQEVPEATALTYPLLSPDGTVWASHQRPATLILTDAMSGERINTIALPNETGAFWRFSPDSRYVVAPLNPYYQEPAILAALRLFDTHTGEVVREMDGQFVGIRDLTFTPDSQIIAAVVCAELRPASMACNAPEIMFWEVATGRQLRSLPIAAGDTTPIVIGMAFDPAGTRLAVTLSNQTLLVYSIRKFQ